MKVLSCDLTSHHPSAKVLAGNREVNVVGRDLDALAYACARTDKLQTSAEAKEDLLRVHSEQQHPERYN